MELTSHAQPSHVPQLATVQTTLCTAQLPQKVTKSALNVIQQAIAATGTHVPLHQEFAKQPVPNATLL